MRVLLPCAAALCLACLLPGCVKGQLPPPPEKAQAVGAEEQKKLLEEIRTIQRDSGATLEQLAKEIARRKAMEAVAVGPSPLQRDLGVARNLLVSARRAVQNADYEAATSHLRRLGTTVDVMQGETPAAQIRTYLERAALALQGSAGGIEADVASACVLAATDVALKSPLATLVPEIAKELEKVKAQVDKGEYKESLRAVTEIAKTLSTHKSVIMLEHAQASVLGAREAMARDAGFVVVAELDQLADLFSNFGTMIRGAPPAEGEAPAEGAKPAKEGEGKPAEKQPAAAAEGAKAPAEPSEPAAKPPAAGTAKPAP